MHMRLSRKGPPRVPVRSGTTASVTHPPAGPLPPARAAEGHGSVSRERLVEPPGCQIRVSDDTLLRRVQDLVGGGNAEHLGTLQHLLLDLCSLDQARQGRVLVDRFDQLSGTPPLDLGHAQPGKDALGDKAGDPSGAKCRAEGKGGSQLSHHDEGEGGVQLAFLRQLCTAMAAAGYRPLTADEWGAALSENFLFTLPVVADYTSMAPGLVPPAWQRHLAAAAAAPPQLAGRALMWHRGAQAARASTPAWALKLDLLLSFWLLQPLWSALAWLMARLGLRLPRAPGVGTRPYASPELGAGATAKPPAKTGSSLGQDGPPGHVIERRTFARAFPNGRAVWRQLTRPVQLQEACFSDVVLLYRPAATLGTATGGPAGSGGRQAQQAAAGVDKAASVEESVGGTSDEAHLVLKQYRRIPLADLEMVLPKASVYLPPNLYLSLTVTLCTGLAAVAAALWQGAKFNAGLLQTVATILLTRAYQMYTYVTNERTAIIKHMTQMLYERTAASQAAVLHTLTAELATQRARQLLITYCAILEAGRTGLPESEVSARCHALLASRIGQQDVHFDAEAPLGQLQAWGLVQHTPGGDSGAGGGMEGEGSALAAVPLAQAVDRLRRALGELAAGEGEEGAAGAGGNPPGTKESESEAASEPATREEAAGEAGTAMAAAEPTAGQAGAANVQAPPAQQIGSASDVPAPLPMPPPAAESTSGGLAQPLPPTLAPAAVAQPDEEGPVAELPPPPSSPQAATLAPPYEHEEQLLMADTLLLPPPPTAAPGAPAVRLAGTGETGGHPGETRGHPGVTVERLVEGASAEGGVRPGSPAGGVRSRLSRLLRPGS